MKTSDIIKGLFDCLMLNKAKLGPGYPSNSSEEFEAQILLGQMCC